MFGADTSNGHSRITRAVQREWHETIGSELVVEYPRQEVIRTAGSPTDLLGWGAKRQDAVIMCFH